MTLRLYQNFVQTALDSNADLYRETHGAIEHGLIEPRRGQALQAAISLTRHLAQEALQHGTEAEVPKSDGQTTHILGQRFAPSGAPRGRK